MIMDKRSYGIRPSSTKELTGWIKDIMVKRHYKQQIY